MLKIQCLNRLCCQRLIKFEDRFLHTTATLDFKNHYEVLGLQRTATSAEIKSAFYEKAKIYHPDTNKTSLAVEKFREISEAYEILSDEAKRRAYDSNTRYESSYEDYVHQREKTYSSHTPRSSTTEPLSMNHIRHVYETLNKEEEVEEPKFRMFENHNYPGSSFNRFEFSRKWNSEKKIWVYEKRKTAEEYNNKMNAKGKILRRWVMLFMSFVGLALVFKSTHTGYLPSLAQLVGKGDLEGKYVMIKGKAKRIDG